jgi:hypothetical protein
LVEKNAVPPLRREKLRMNERTQTPAAGALADAAYNLIVLTAPDELPGSRRNRALKTGKAERKRV